MRIDGYAFLTSAQLFICSAALCASSAQRCGLFDMKRDCRVTANRRGDRQQTMRLRKSGQGGPERCWRSALRDDALLLLA